MGCRKNRFKRLLIPFIALYFMISVFIVPAASARSGTDSDTWEGPYVDAIRYVYINGSDPNDWYDEYRAQIQALIDGDIDVMTTQAHDFEDIAALETAPNVERVQFWRHAAFNAEINCERWPLNISDFRRALHLALDKNAMAAIQGGIPHDSYFASPHPYSIEPTMEHHYYEAEVSAGAAILDSLGFLDIDGDGWREGPDGAEIPPINIKFWRGEGSGPLNEDNANLIAEALQNMKINAYTTRISDSDYSVELLTSFDFDIYLWAMVGSDYTLDSWVNSWLDQPTWSNARFEELADVALHSVDEDEVEDAIREMQYIMVEDAPIIILLHLPLYSGYRTDRFDGIVEDSSYGPHSFFTGLNATSKSGAFTDRTIRYGTTGFPNEEVTLEPVTCGIGLTNWFSVKSHMEMMYDSLARMDPDVTVVNWLAKNYTIETHEDDETIIDGRTRIVIDLVENARFSDGVPLTAEDVVYSILWFNENFNYKTVHGSNSDTFEIVECSAKSPFQVEIQLSTESFWHWYKICFMPILPKHASNQYESLIGFRLTPDEFNEDFVVSGPFMASEWVPNEYIEVVQNPYYWKKPATTITTTTTTTTTTVTPPPDVDLVLPFIAGIAGAATIIIVGGFAILKKD